MDDICFGMKMLCLVQIWSQILKIYESFTVLPRKLKKFEGFYKEIKWHERSIGHERSEWPMCLSPYFSASVKNVTWILLEILCNFMSQIDGSLVQIDSKCHDFSMSFMQVSFVFHAKTRDSWGACFENSSSWETSSQFINNLAIFEIYKETPNKFFGPFKVNKFDYRHRKFNFSKFEF